MDQELDVAVSDPNEQDSSEPAGGDFVQAGAADDEPRIENSLGDHHHQR